MIASLPMYWRAENAEAWRAFWDLLRQAHGPGLPKLTAPEHLPADWSTHWLAPDLALSMTCGLPFRTVLKDRVSYVGTLDFGLCDQPGFYRSAIIRRPGPIPAKGLRLAYNAPDSQSGWAAVDLAPAQVIGWIETGSHAGSLAAVADGRADIAWIDALTWRLLRAHDPNAARVVVAGQTEPTPGLPLIAAAGRDPAPLRSALRDAVTGLGDDLRADLVGLRGFAVLDPVQYTAMPVPVPPPA